MKLRATSTLILPLRARCSWTPNLNLGAMRRGGGAAEFTSRIKKCGTSVFQIAIRGIQSKNPQRILECRP